MKDDAVAPQSNRKNNDHCLLRGAEVDPRSGKGKCREARGEEMRPSLEIDFLGG